MCKLNQQKNKNKCIPLPVNSQKQLIGILAWASSVAGVSHSTLAQLFLDGCLLLMESGPTVLPQGTSRFVHCSREASHFLGQYLVDWSWVLVSRLVSARQDTIPTVRSSRSCHGCQRGHHFQHPQALVKDSTHVGTCRCVICAAVRGYWWSQGRRIP